MSSVTKVVCFDLDGTLIQGYDATSITLACTLNGRREEMLAIEEARIRGEFDWIAADYQKAALLKGLPLSRLAAEFPRQCRPIGGIRETVDALHREGIRCLLVTSGPVQSAQAFALHWGLDAWDGSHYGVTDGIFDGALPGHIGDRGKIQCVERYCSQVGASLAEVTAVGDGGTDIPLFGRCGCSIALNYGPEAEGKATHYLRTDDLSHILPLVP